MCSTAPCIVSFSKEIAESMFLSEMRFSISVNLSIFCEHVRLSANIVESLADQEYFSCFGRLQSFNLALLWSQLVVLKVHIMGKCMLALNSSGKTTKSYIYSSSSDDTMK